MWGHNQTLCTVTSKDRDEDEIWLSDGISHTTTWMWNLDMDKRNRRFQVLNNGAGEESSLLEYDTMFQRS